MGTGKGLGVTLFETEIVTLPPSIAKLTRGQSLTEEDSISSNPLRSGNTRKPPAALPSPGVGREAFPVPGVRRGWQR